MYQPPRCRANQVLGVYEATIRAQFYSCWRLLSESANERCYERGEPSGHGLHCLCEAHISIVISGRNTETSQEKHQSPAKRSRLGTSGLFRLHRAASPHSLDPVQFVNLPNGFSEDATSAPLILTSSHLDMVRM